MKPAQAPQVPGDTEAQRMSNALRKVLTVSKADLLKAEEKWNLTRPKKKQAKKAS